MPAAVREEQDENNVHELHQAIVHYDWPLIPNGIYNAVLLHYEGCLMSS